MSTPGNTAHEQLTGDQLQQLKWMLGGVLTLVSVATVFYLDINAWVLMALTILAVVIVTVRPQLPGKIPRWAHRLAFPLIVALFTADLWLTAELLPSMVRLDILLLLYRSITYRQKRDDLQLVVLGLFLVVVAGVLTVSLTFAVHILLFTAGALALLLVVTLAEASAGLTNKPLQPGAVPAWALAVDWRRLLSRVRHATNWRVVAMGIGLFVGLVALSALLFVAIPRFQLENGLFLERFISKKTKSGFSDTIRFGDVTEIQQDNSVALSVDVSDRNQIPTTPYWRMMVLDEYSEGTFRLSAGLRRSSFSVERRGASIRGSVRGGGMGPTWTFYLEAGISRYLPLLGPFREILLREPHSHRTVSGLELVALSDEPATMLAYRVQSMAANESLADADFARRFALSGGNSLAAPTLMLGLPLGEPDRATLKQIVQEITEGVALTPDEFGSRASAWLARKHSYSLSPKFPAGAGDPLVRWLASTESGHCELFAGSLVVLARSEGFPARIVTGFKGGSWNGYSNNFTVRNSDAHAWCEVFDAKRQAWIRVDPTPGLATAGAATAAAETAAARRNDRSWKARMESLRVFWYRQIVNFDQRSQIDTINAVKRSTEGSSRWLRETLDGWSKDLKTWGARPWNGRRWAGVVSVIAAVFVTWRFSAQLYRWWRFKVGASRGRGPTDRARAEAGRWLARFHGYQTRVAPSPTATELIRQLQRIRYGVRETWGEIDPIFRRARQVLRDEKRRGRAQV